MKKILGEAKTVSNLLSKTKYTIDYYQREYRWQTKQMGELLRDLAKKFEGSYAAADERSAVESYEHYFLGSIIISERDGKKFIVDGQQRLTSLTLLLIFLHRCLETAGQNSPLDDLIFSLKYNKLSFNLDVPDRTVCMEALFKGNPFDDTDQPESVVNIIGRYHDIEEQFPEHLKGAALPYFADWLIENVHLVQITAQSDEDAYTIFETMNDRGLSLTPADMLKGYLLANITDPEVRNRAGKVWRERVAECQDWDNEEDADAIKAWLRSQYAEKTRERKRNANPEDFDLIGTEFHRWVRDHEKALQLKGSGDFAGFIERNFNFYTRQYLDLRWAGYELKPGLEPVFFNAQNNFTLQYAVLLAPLKLTDKEPEIQKKLRVVATFIDVLIARRVWNSQSIDYSTMQYAMFIVIKEIRGKSAADAAALLVKRLAQDARPFSDNDYFSLHGMNRRQIHRILARITDYIETESGGVSRYEEYIGGGKDRYEVEHVWANHPERHKDEFDHQSDFQSARNRIGGLLLLRKSFNASFGDLTYKKKRPHYNSQNLLARSLDPQCYEHNPKFKKFVKESGLPFEPHEEFKAADLKARCDLYIQIAEHIWNPERIEAAAQ